MSEKNEGKDSKALIRKIVEKIKEEKKTGKAGLVLVRKNTVQHSDSAKKEEQPESGNFDLNRHEREVLTVEKTGISRLLAALSGESLEETRTDTESVKNATENLRARRELRDEIVNITLQPIKAEETLLDARTSLMKKKLSHKLEAQRHEIESQRLRIETVKLQKELDRMEASEELSKEVERERLELEREEIKKKVRELREGRGAEKEDERSYDFESLNHLAEKKEKDKDKE